MARYRMKCFFVLYRFLRVEAVLERGFYADFSIEQPLQVCC